MLDFTGGSRWSWLGVGLGILGGCDASAGSGAAFTVRDSVGVRIVESVAPEWGPGEGWSVGEDPALQIGEVEGEDPYQFSRIPNVFRTVDGGFVVGDFRAAQVRFFRPDGAFRSSFGRPGAGPGEFQRFLSWVEPYRGDSIVAFDAAGRVTIADREGEIGRVFTPNLPPMPEVTGDRPTLIAPGAFVRALEDGSFLAVGPELIQGELGTRFRGTLALLRYSPQGDSLTRYGEFPGFERIMPDRSPSADLRMTPYPRQTVYASRGDRVYVGTGAVEEVEAGTGHGMEIRVFTAGGELRQVIRSFDRDLTLTDRHREAFREFQRGRASPERPAEAIERALATLDYPDRIPPYDQLLVDSEDHLWVQHDQAPGMSAPQTWRVFAPGGRLLGTVVTPERFQVREIGRTWILGTWVDDLDVRYVRMYPLERE